MTAGRAGCQLKSWILNLWTLVRRRWRWSRATCRAAEMSTRRETKKPLSPFGSCKASPHGLAHLKWTGLKSSMLPMSTLDLSSHIGVA